MSLKERQRQAQRLTDSDNETEADTRTGLGLFDNKQTCKHGEHSNVRDQPASPEIGYQRGPDTQGLVGCAVNHVAAHEGHFHPGPTPPGFSRVATTLSRCPAETGLVDLLEQTFVSKYHTTCRTKQQHQRHFHVSNGGEGSRAKDREAAAAAT